MTSRTPCASSIGRKFHSLQATSQALQPMHTEVSVKKPTRAGWSPSYPASPWTSGSGPYSRLSGSRPVKAGLAELTEVTPVSCLPLECSRLRSLAGSRLRFLAGSQLRSLAGLGGDRVAAVDPDPPGRHPGPLPVALHELDELGPARSPSRPDVGGADLVLLDVRVRVEHDPEQVVGPVAGRDAAVGPVVGHPDLVHDLPVAPPDRPEPLRSEEHTS